MANENLGFHGERNATKADIAEIKGDIRALAVQVKLLIGLVAGLYVGIGVLLIDKLAK